MSIRLRFTTLLTVLGLALLVGYSIIAYRGEQDDLRASTEREVRLLGRSLEIALGNALRDRQQRDIDETFAALEGLAPAVDLDVHDAAGDTIAHSEGASVDAEIEALVARARITRTELLQFDPADGPRRILYAAPLLSDDGTPLGTFALVRPLDDLDADLARTRWRLFATLGAFLVLTSLAGFALGTLYIRRPVARVLDGIRHVRGGDLRSRVSAAHDDEIGALVAEFNAMVAALDLARQRIEREVEARMRVERGLRDVDKMITIAQLSAGLAHEIGSPLQVLSGRAQALLDDSDDPQVRRQAQILVEQTDRITGIVEQLLSFGRSRPPRIARCDLAQPVRAVLDLLDGEALRSDIHLVLEQDGHDHRIDGDADQLQQVALNLIRNALSVTPANGTVTVRIEGGGDGVRLRVRDTGPGIAAEIRPRLFEPFFTTRSAQGGTGLGLAVVRAIVTEHGGTIAVESAPAHGAEFTVTFPPAVTP
jgi:signal transduction histidine kinase